MRILITGGAGFVGSNLALALRAASEAEVVCMDNLFRRGSDLNLPRLAQAGAKFVWGDIRQPEDFPPGPFDVVIECSAEPSVLAGRTGTPDYLFRTNLVGAYHALEKARVWGSHFIFMSTSRVYPVGVLEAHPWVEHATRFAWDDGTSDGISSQGVTERIEMDSARSLYGYTKYSIEQLIMEYADAFDLSATVNRCGVIAGPWQFGKVDQGVTSLWVMAHHFGRPLSYIGYGGEGKQVRDILHVADLCDLICLQVRDSASWKGWVGNVSGGLSGSASLLELTALCREATGSRVPISSVAQTRPSDLRLYLGDCTRLFARTTWRPARTVVQVVEDTAEWVRTHEAELAKL